MNPSRLLRSIRRKFERTCITPGRIRQLTTSVDARVAGVGRAIEKTRYGSRTPEEDHWIQAIEKRRAALLASREIFEVLDFGAGTPADTRTQDQMSAGRVCTEVVGEACLKYSKEPYWAELLFHIIRQIKPVSCIEMGACVGISGAYQAAALELNGAGALHTMEGSPSFARITTETFETLGLKHRATVAVGRFFDTVDSVLTARAPVDCCFIDGHHDEMATIQYFAKVLPHLTAQAVLLFDDIRWSPGMIRAWERIRSDSRAGVSIDLGKIGICLTGAGRAGRFSICLE